MTSSIGVIDVLIKNGANIAAKDSRGRTPLIRAISSGENRTRQEQLSLLERLLNVRFGNEALNTADNDGLTPLMYSIMKDSRTNDNTFVTELLKIHKSYLNKQDKKGRTALDIAEEQNVGHDTLRYLRSKGAVEGSKVK